jgi:hypothetical protein
MTDRGVTTLQRRIMSALKWMKRQREQNLDMVTDAGDASLWCKDEADTIRDHMNAIRDLWRHCEELDFLRHEGGPQSVAAIEAALKPFAVFCAQIDATEAGASAPDEKVIHPGLTVGDFRRAARALGGQP